MPRQPKFLRYNDKGNYHSQQQARPSAVLGQTTIYYYMYAILYIYYTIYTTTTVALTDDEMTCFKVEASMPGLQNIPYKNVPQTFTSASYHAAPASSTFTSAPYHPAPASLACSGLGNIHDLQKIPYKNVSQTFTSAPQHPAPSSLACSGLGDIHDLASKDPRQKRLSDIH